MKDNNRECEIDNTFFLPNWVCSRGNHLIFKHEKVKDDGKYTIG